jgi:hypothetical protein
MSRLLALMGVALLTATTAASRAQPEPPRAFLHCIGETTDHKATEHTITIYSKTAIMDSQKYDLYSDDAHYALQADQLMFDMMDKPPWIVIVAINRVTRSYEISRGPNLVERFKIDEGTCTKMDRQF